MIIILKIAGVVSIMTSVLLSQFNPGARDISLAGSRSPVSADIFSLYNNPAGLSEYQSREIGIFYSPSPFGFYELSNAYAAYSEPFNWGTVSIGGMTYGYKLFREIRISGGFSYQYSDDVLLGAVLNYHNISIARYGNASALCLNVGVIYTLSSFLRGGLYIHNINHATYKSYPDQIPLIFCAGIGLNVADNILVTASVEKDNRYRAALSGGVDYAITDNFSLRVGTGSEPARYTAGVGVNYKFISFDYAVLIHPELGLTHQVGLLIDIQE